MKWSLIAAMLSLTMFGFAGCSKSTATATQNQTDLSVIEQNKYLTARLYGLMSFDFSGTPVSFPTELTISSVPISWMGPIFNGTLQNSGPGNDVTDQVHGSISSDGKWLLLLTYSRQIARPNQKSIFYRITLKNVPITQADSRPAGTPGSFDETGDVQKYVDQIEYSEGIFTNGSIVPEISYVSTDWSNSTPSLQPALRVIFELKPSQIFGPMPPPQPGMGMGRS